MKPRSSADVRREAWRIVAKLITSYFDVGQPFEECTEDAVQRGEDHADSCDRCLPLAAALKVIKRQAEQKAQELK